MQKSRSTRSLTALSSFFISSVTASLALVLAFGGITEAQAVSTPKAITVLKSILVKGRAPKTGYARSQFGDGWGNIGSCDTRNYILIRDLKNITYRDSPACTVATGTLRDPYTATTIHFVRGVSTSLAVQIDHVVPLSDAWQKGAQKLSYSTRMAFANDPLNLLAVDGPTNGAKSDSDAATWLPPNRAYWCPYVARQVAVKAKYKLWMTGAEKARISQILTSKCPNQLVPRG
ncbi:MAG: HNH endonuclease family protein [Rhodoluna sp.]|nr:HNH endonuclease family protein [Rhodoluna sp.]